MKKINIEFKEDSRQQAIKVIITAERLDDQVKELMKRVSDPFDNVFSVYDEKGAVAVLPFDKIISISSDRRKLKVVADNGIFELRSSLQDVEKQLRSSSFIKISRYEIINLHKVAKFDFSISGSLRIEMNNGMQTWASRRNIGEIKKRLMRKDEDL